MTQTDVQDALVKSEFDLQGRLGNFLISDLLQMIQLSGKTGTLTLLQGWNNRKITCPVNSNCLCAQDDSPGIKSRRSGSGDRASRTKR